MFVHVYGVSDVQAVDGGVVSLRAMYWPFTGHIRQVRVFLGEDFWTGLSLLSILSSQRWMCSQRSEPTEHGRDFVCMQLHACAGVFRSSEDIRVHMIVWLYDRDQY